MADEEQSKNPVLYGVGLISLTLSLALFTFSLYIMPYMLFDFVYDVPQFVILIVYWYENLQGYTGVALLSIVLLPFLLSATILALIAKRLTFRMEKGQKFEMFSLNFETKGGLMKLVQPALYEIFLILVVLFFLYLAEFFIVIQFE